MKRLNHRFPSDAKLIGRAWDPAVGGPCVVAVRDGRVFDITSAAYPTVRDLFELPAPCTEPDASRHRVLGSVAQLLCNADPDARDDGKPWILAPVDLQAIKASGVTFAESLLERIIEEQARGDARKALALRAAITDTIGGSLGDLEPGSAPAAALKERLIALGLWSQYLEVGIGPDPEIFTKAQPMSAVGCGAHVGVLSGSHWNNPEPEVVLVVNSRGNVVGASLGNDVNLRDIEGRSALLLGKAKDNNASCAIGPFIRVFDDRFSLPDIDSLSVKLRIDGLDGFTLEGVNHMGKISRSPEALVAAAFGRHHQYPDGFCLFLGTMFAPTQDRDAAGEGFTHHPGDRVAVACAPLGELVNVVRSSEQCEPWTFGVGALMRNLSGRGLLPTGSAS